MKAITVDRERLQQRVCKVLKDSREDRDMSQKELGRKVGMNRNQIANLEGGRRALRVADFVVIARALRVDPTTLLWRICGREVDTSTCPLAKPSTTRTETMIQARSSRSWSIRASSIAADAEVTSVELPSLHRYAS